MSDKKKISSSVLKDGYEPKVDITSEKMPEELQTKLELLTPFARRYAELRATTLKQADAAKKAGSQASTRQSLTRVGYNTEQLDGVKEYIMWLEYKRAKASAVDEIEIVQMIRDTYKSAMMDGKYNDANKAAELLGNMIGAFANKNASKDTAVNEGKNLSATKNNTTAFKEDNADIEEDDRVAKLTKMLQDAKHVVVKE